MNDITDHPTQDIVRLNELESDIEQSLIQLGNALREIKDSGLYKAQYGTWDNYLRQRWSKSTSWGTELRLYAPIAERIQSATGVTPSQNVVRQLRKVSDSPDEQLVIAQTAIQTAKIYQQELTATHITQVANVMRDMTTTGAVDTGTGDSVPVVNKAVEVARIESQARRQQHMDEKNGMEKVLTYVDARLVIDGGATLIELEDDHPLSNFPNFAELKVSVWIKKHD